ncbi:MAG: DUF2975 domain-containing protein [Candidatus Zixiibacteriota bacterium]|nr:MAG: DUF2975 domain-containing protein [candidate division Zixibacteria bacterium]
MDSVIQCRKCGVAIALGEAKPGEQLTCEKCDTINVIPLPAPQTGTIKIMSVVIDWIWYISCVVFGFSAVVILLCVPNIGDQKLWSWEKAPIPIRVTYDQPIRVEPDESVAAADALHVRGYEVVLVDRWLAGEMALHWVAALLTIGLLLWVVYQVRAFFHNVRSGRPFSRDNPRRIRYMAYSIVAFVVLDIITIISIAHAYMKRIDIPGAQLEVAIPWIDTGYVELIALGILLFVIAQIFDWGCRLQQEHDLTI